MQIANEVKNLESINEDLKNNLKVIGNSTDPCTWCRELSAAALARKQIGKPPPVRKSALALISELEKPADCDTASCLSQVLSAKLSAAVAGLHSIVAVDEVREAVIGDYQKRIEIRGGIIDDLNQVNKNNQRIDSLGQDYVRVAEAQHRDDKSTIDKLGDKLESCQSNQKYVFVAGALTGGAIAWKVKGSNVANSVLNPFQFNPGQLNQWNGISLYQTSPEERVRQAFKKAQKLN